MNVRPPWEILRLGPAHLTLARKMNALYAAAFEDPASYAAAPPGDGYLSALLANSDAIALIARSDDQVIGALTAYTLRKFEQARSEIYIYDLAVAETMRKRCRDCVDQCGSRCCARDRCMGRVRPSRLWR
jgi:aminoglycoside 3-N-acetyltransferase I